MKEITRYDFCVDDIGNEAFMPCPDGRYVLLEEVEAYLPHDEDDQPKPVKKFKSVEENYIYLPMRNCVRSRYNKQTCQFEQSRETDEMTPWNDHVQQGHFYVVEGNKEMRNQLAEIMNKEK